MSDSDFIRYQSAIAQGHVMLARGLISDQEFRLFEEEMRRKYNLPEGSIFRDYHLLYRPQ